MLPASPLRGLGANGSLVDTTRCNTTHGVIGGGASCVLGFSTAHASVCECSAANHSLGGAFSLAEHRARPVQHYYDLGMFSSSLPNSYDTLCMLNRQRERTLSRPTVAPTAAGST